MNILGLIFSVLATLLFTLNALFQKQMSAKRIRSSYIGHLAASRELLSSYEKQMYNSIPSRETSAPKKRPSSKATALKQEKKDIFPESNPLCARINLFSLILEGKKKEPYLYGRLEALISCFYGKILPTKKERDLFLHDFLSSCREQLLSEGGDSLSLEKLPMKTSSHRYLLCKMLKGSKTCKLFEGQGYPPLDEYIVISNQESKICIKHAHPYLLSVFFGPKVAKDLYQKIHEKEVFTPTKKMVETILTQSHNTFHNREMLALFQFEKKRCKREKMASFTGKDETTEILLKRKIRTVL